MNRIDRIIKKKQTEKRKNKEHYNKWREREKENKKGWG